MKEEDRSQPTILLNLLSIFLVAKLLPHCFNACIALHSKDILHLIRAISFQIRGIILGLALLLMFYAGEMQICVKPALHIEIFIYLAFFVLPLQEMPCRAARK